MECGIPLGKYQRSPSVTSLTKLLPPASPPVMRAFPYSIMDHSAAVCPCSSLTPPLVTLMAPPAVGLETGRSGTVASRDLPPSCTGLRETAKGYLDVG